MSSSFLGPNATSPTLHPREDKLKKMENTIMGYIGVIWGLLPPYNGESNGKENGHRDSGLQFESQQGAGFKASKWELIRVSRKI